MKEQPRKNTGRLGFAGVSAWMLAGIVLATPWRASAVSRQTVSTPVLAVTERLAPVQAMAATARLNLAIGIPLRDEAGLKQTLQSLYDPSSPQYHHWFKPEELAAKYCATPQDYQAVLDWAKSKNLTVTATHPNRICVEVEGSVADIDKAFNITLQVYNHPTEARTFFAPNTAPTVDSPVPILTIDGLDNYYQVKPNSRLKYAAPTSGGPQAGGNTPQDGGSTPSGTGSAPGGAYATCDFRSAYVPGTTLRGYGQNVGLLQYDDYYDLDIANYETQFSLQSLSPIRVVVNGPMPAPGSGDGEVSLDIEMVLSMAPSVANIYVYEAPNVTANWVPLLSRIQTDNLCQQVSCSWSGGGVNASGENVFLLMAGQGMSFFNATGDQDAFLGSISFPSMSPNITECGGTTLTTSGPCGSYVSETVWNWNNGTGSSGGWTNSYGIPWWQQGIDMTLNLGSTTYRNVPDVALTGDNCYVRYNNGAAGVFGGTSCAAPLWAGFMALVNEQAAQSFRAGQGFLNPALYAVAKSPTYTVNFHDITTGNNQKSGSGALYSAQVGYDLCTGWGTPAGQALIDYLAGTPPGVPNGGFETGDFSQWQTAGNMADTFASTGLPHSGNYSAALGPIGSLGYIDQELPTVPGQVYLLSFWLYNTAGTTPVNEFSVYCNGTLLDLVNASSFGWTLYQYVVPANYFVTYLQFGFRNDPGYYYLDDVNFTPLPGAVNLTPGLPVNGGFETGNTANWGVSGSFISVFGNIPPFQVHSGNNSLGMGTVGADGTLTQVVPTVPGQNYQLHFWLAHPYSATPSNDFHVIWNGTSLADLTNLSQFNYESWIYNVTATGAVSTLQFAARNDPDFLFLDDITLTPLANALLGQVAYVRSAVGEPWGANDNRTALDTVFGSGNWNDTRFETVDPSVLFSPAVHFVFMDGSDSGANALSTFLTANRALIQSWVSNGGSLFLNAAPNQGGNINFGFGVTLNYNGGTSLNRVASAHNPEHPVVNGPFLPVGTSWSGNAFAHAFLTGSGFTSVLDGTNGSVLAEMNIGRGHALFGGLTIPTFHLPEPQGVNLLANILAYGNTTPQGTFEDLPEPGGSGLPVPNGYLGVNWNNFYYVDSTSLGASGYGPGAVSPNNCGYNNFGNPASITSGSPFNFMSAWVTAAWNDNLALEVKGLRNGVLVYDQSYTLSATAPALLTFNLLNVTEVDLISSGGTPHGGGYVGSGTQFAIDDLVLTTAAASPAAGVDHFDFSAVPAAQCLNAAFPVTVTALDPSGAAVAAFGSPVTLSGYAGTGSLVEGFESGTWPAAPWVITVPGTPGAIGTAFAHDGTYGLQDPEWDYRTDVSIGNGGDVLSWWVRPSNTGAGGGRAYLGFGATAAGAWSAVVAANANSFIIQQNAGYSYQDMVSAPQAYVAGKWYKVAVYFDSPTVVTAVLFDSDGETVLNKLTLNGVTGLPGGVAMRSFAGFSLDTIRGGPLTPVFMTPNLASFSGGTWSGNVTVLQPEAEMVLFANDGFSGAAGVSNPFHVDFDPPTLGPVTRIPGGISLTWSTCPGGVYQVEYTTSLNLPITWNNLGGPITAGGTSLSFSDTFSGPMRFYKIVMLP